VGRRDIVFWERGDRRCCGLQHGFGSATISAVSAFPEDNVRSSHSVCVETGSRNYRTVPVLTRVGTTGLFRSLNACKPKHSGTALSSSPPFDILTVLTVSPCPASQNTRAPPLAAPPLRYSVCSDSFRMPYKPKHHRTFAATAGTPSRQSVTD